MATSQVTAMLEQDNNEPVYSTLRCSAAYHISQLKGAGEESTFLLYDRCCALGHDSHRAFLNLRQAAPYLHRSEDSLYRSAKLLVAAGWLLVESRKNGSPTTYRPVSHEEYVAAHGEGSCVQTYSPDYWKSDALGSAFYGITGGVKVGGPNVLAGWRRLFSQDELILMHAEKFVSLNPKPAHKHEYTTWLKGFGQYLREQSC
jgi:hypothetical protein